MNPNRIVAGRRAQVLGFDLDTDEVSARARICSSLVSFDDQTEPAPSFDSTTLIDNAPLP